MITPSKKLLSLFLVFSLMALSVNLFAKEKQGAKLIVTKLDGELIKGELIAVKPNSLLLLDTEGKDVSVDIGGVKVIKIVKKSKFWTGAGSGLLIGGCFGALFGFTSGGKTYRAVSMFGGVSNQTTSGEEALGWGVLFGSIGLLIGGFLGASAGKDERIQIEGMPPAFIEFNLQKLRKKARIRDYK